MLFSTYGQVISIIALKTPKMRGQAHVVFNSTAEATTALKALQGFELFDKPVNIAYAKSKSDVIAKRDGTFKLRLPPSSAASSLPPASLNSTIAAFDADDGAAPTTKRKRDEEGAVAYASDFSSNDENDNDEDDN
jgi:RNA recognition motif-containing protein